MKISERNFILGVNYWPRDAGVRMWTDWAPELVDADFAAIRALGCTVVRVFLTWNDFQPLAERGTAGATREVVMRHDESITSDICPAMVDERMIARFDALLQIAEKHGVRLIVALMTGWMSGVLLDVDWRQRRNLFADPFMLKWQLLYCQYFARRYRNCGTILAWEFGNEQNCFMSCESPDAAWTWMRSLANQLRVEDPEHLVLPGMHGLAAYPRGGQAPWGIREVAAHCDWLTTHPYPPFTPGCNMDRLTDMRANMHASAEGRYYAGLGGKPVLCEETGALGDTCLCEERTADFIRLRLHSLLANDALGCLWWCFSDFKCTGAIPYRWNQMEQNGLGLLATDGRVKPAGEEYRRFNRMLERVGRLPPTIRQAAIVVMAGVNQWELYYNTFVLCKRAGIEADFIFSHQPFDQYRLLVCPSVAGECHYHTPDWERMRQFARAGGVLYLSYDGAALTRLPEFFGIRSLARTPFPDAVEAKIVPADGTASNLAGVECQYRGKPCWHLEFEPVGARVLMRWLTGLPALTEYACGAGRTVFMGLPPEALLARTPYAFDQDNTALIYEYIRDLAGIQPELDIAAPDVERTYHPISDREGCWMAINYARTPCIQPIRLSRPVHEFEALSDENSGCIEQDARRWKVTLPPLSALLARVFWD